MHKLPQNRRAIKNGHSNDADTNEKIMYEKTNPGAS